MMGLWQLHPGDCLRGLREVEDDAFDHAITDPPYGAQVDEGFRSLAVEHRNETGPASSYIGLGIGVLDEALAVRVSLELARVVRRWVLVFSDVENVHTWRHALTLAGLDYVRTGMWVKKDSAPQFSGDRPANACEAIAIAHRPGRKRWNGGGKRGVWFSPICKGKDRFHSTQKPLPLMEDLLRDFTDPGEIVLDPFAGAATTGVAALNLDRRFTGWEMNPGYHEKACARLAAAEQQRALFST